MRRAGINSFACARLPSTVANVRADRGIVFDGPSRYADNANCHWKITRISTGGRLELRLLEVHTPPLKRVARMRVSPIVAEHPP